VTPSLELDVRQKIMDNQPYLNPSTLSKVVVTLIIFGGILDLTAAFSSYLEYNLLASVRDGSQVTTEMANANDNRQMVIGVSQTILYLVTTVFFAKWLYRMSRNAHAIGNKSLKYTPGWSIGYYFIPILNLFRPYQCLRESYESFIEKDEAKDNWIFPLWWFAWLVSNIVGRALLKASIRAEELDELINASIMTISNDIFNVFLDVIALLLILLVTRSCISRKIKFSQQNVREEF